MSLTLVVVALLSFVTVAAINLVAARELLDTGARDQLSGVGQARARTIEAGANRVRSHVSAIAADLAVAQAMEDLNDGYARTRQTLDQASTTELDAYYRRWLADSIEVPGLDPVTVDELRPRSETSRYLQFHYTAAPVLAGTPRRVVSDPADGSAYSRAHAEHHGYLAELANLLGARDLLLISPNGTVVYSVEKQIDFGADLTTGPLARSALATAVGRDLTRVAAGDAVIADWEPYLPAGGQPALFILTAISSDTAYLGAIAVQLPSEALSAITTAEGRWRSVGLPFGESYVVGSDLVLTSESRRWLEDPESYLEMVDPELGALIQTFGSPVGFQPVETAPARVALDGRGFDGRSTNYLGEESFSSAVPIDVEGVHWVVVVDTPLDEARAPLVNYLRAMGLVLALVVGLAVLFGFGLAARLTKPVRPLSAAARAVAEGDRNPRVAELGRDELGDLGRRLERMAAELGRQEAELEAEFEQKRQLLRSVLPARLIDLQGEISGRSDSVDVVTAIAVVLAVNGGASGSGGTPPVDTLAAVAKRLSRRAVEHGIEPVRLAADRSLFLAGVESPDDGAANALEFAAELGASIRQVADEAGFDLSVHIGLSTGAVATGVLARGSLTFGAWGDAVRRALTIAALARSDELLVDTTTADAAGPTAVDLRPARDVIGLDGAPLQLMAARLPAPERPAPSRPSPG